MTPRVSIVVPFYNELDNVEPLRRQIAAAFEAQPVGTYECVFVDDGSTDGTGRTLQAMARDDDALRPIFLARNSGQSAALMAGLRAARGEYLITLDGDLQNDPADIPKVVELLGDYDCVCGVRTKRQDDWLRKVSSRVANVVRNAILHDGIRDTGCGLKGFRRECVDALPCFNGVHRFFPVFIRQAGFSIVECPANHRPREHGKSKYGVGNRLWRGIYDLIGVAWLRRRLVTYALAAAPAEAADRVEPERSAPLDTASAVQDR